MNDFFEIQKSIVDIGLRVVSKNSIYFDKHFEKFSNTVLKFNKICTKIAETKTFDVETLKDAKDVVNVFRVNMKLLNALNEVLQLWLEEGKEVKKVLILVFKIKREFEAILSCIEKYAFKLNQRIYDIPQDRDINMQIVQTMESFELICNSLKTMNNYSSFVMDIERMNKRYNYIKNVPTYVLRKADIVTK